MVDTLIKSDEIENNEELLHFYNILHNKDIVKNIDTLLTLIELKMDEINLRSYHIGKNL